MSDFNKILHQRNATSNCKQIRQISIKSVNACKPIVKSPKNISVHYRQPHKHVTVKVYVCVYIKHT